MGLIGAKTPGTLQARLLFGKPKNYFSPAPFVQTMPAEAVGRVAAAAAKKSQDSGKKIAPVTASFHDLGVDEWLCDTLKAMQIKRPSEIQRACIPPALAGSCL